MREAFGKSGDRKPGVVGDPGIEPGMGLPGGVTVRCRTLQHVARLCTGPNGPDQTGRCLSICVQRVNWAILEFRLKPAPARGEI